MLAGGRPLSSAAAPSRRRAFVVLLSTAAVVFAVDHVVKWIIVREIPLNEQRPESGPITLHHIQNSGAAFGLFPQLQTVFLVVAVLVSVYILVAGHRFGSGLLTQITLGAILGGATANAVDRFVQGYVVDFVDLHRWPVFNVADSAIVVGIAVAILTFGGSHQPEEVKG
ncbi:MAG TPA: signal peptidase II [Candidatus Dormibacteraeota bacterium]|nr:signal peptidase II [Candidatus Dormibacteraeota bacterium]